MEEKYIYWDGLAISRRLENKEVKNASKKPKQARITGKRQQ